MANVTRAHRACDDQLHRSQARIKELERQLASSEQIRTAEKAILIAEIEAHTATKAQLAALDWSPITQDNPAPIYSVVIGPKKPDFPHLPPWKAKVIMTSTAEAQLAQGWTHFCPHNLPINAPAPPHTGAKYE